MTPPIRIGQIGICHEHASGAFRTVRQLPDLFDIVGVVDDRDTCAARFAGDDLRPYEGVPRMSEDELLAVPELQAILVETPNTDLVSTALRCLDRGLPLHMDKPGGEDLALFRHLLAGCRKRNVPLQMGYMFRTNPAMRLCLRAVREGWLGDVFEVHASMSHDYGGDAYQTYLGCFRGGIMFNLGCHLIDFVVALLGRPRRVTPFLSTASDVPDHVVNHALAVLEYPRTLASVQACSREVGGINRRRLKVCGTGGTFELSPLERFDGKPLTARLTLKEANEHYAAGDHILDLGVRLDRYEGQMRELAAIVRGEIVNPYSYEHDELVQEVLLAAAGYREWDEDPHMQRTPAPTRG